MTCGSHNRSLEIGMCGPMTNEQACRVGHVWLPVASQHGKLVGGHTPAPLAPPHHPHQHAHPLRVATLPRTDPSRPTSPLSTQHLAMIGQQKLRHTHH